MARWSARRTAFRAVMAGEACLSPASVFDPMSARVARDIGYETGILAGSTASMTVLGAPDLIVLTLTELADQAHRIGRATDLPLLVDADHGYGNALNVMRTVEELEAAGVAALSIEDTDLPPRYGSPDASTLLSIEESTAKMRAAMAAKPDPDLMVLGRTGAAKLTDIEDCRARVAAFDAAGVDGLFLVGVPDRAAYDAIAAATDKPIVLGSAGPDLTDRGYLAARGARLLLTGHQPIAAALNAVHDTLLALREGRAPAGLPDKALTDTALRRDAYRSWTRGFLDG
jgi:carboxyvinyl-carboxyphosphonate phosphorylmutase